MMTNPAHNSIIGAPLSTRQAGTATAPSRRSRASLGDRSRRRLQRTVTWRDRRAELTAGFRLIAGARCWPSFPGLSSSGRCPLTTAAPFAALATIQPAFTDAERFALAGFLAGYRG